MPNSDFSWTQNTFGGFNTFYFESHYKEEEPIYPYLDIQNSKVNSQIKRE